MDSAKLRPFPRTVVCQPRVCGVTRAPSYTSATLELQAQDELEASRRARADRSGVDNAGDVAEAGGRGPCRAGSLVFRMIEQIESFAAYIEAEPLAEGELLVQRAVNLVHPGTDCDIPAEIAVCPRRGIREGTGVEPTVGSGADRPRIGIDRSADVVGPLPRSVPVERRGFRFHADIHRQPGADCEQARQFPPAHNLICDAAVVHELAAFPERQLVNRSGYEVMAHVPGPVTAVAGPAGLVLKRRRVAGAGGGVRDAVRPRVLTLPEPTVGKPPLQRHLERVFVVVAVVLLRSEEHTSELQ